MLYPPGPYSHGRTIPCLQELEEGLYEGDEEENQGTVYYNTGAKYQGEWQAGLRHGYGIYTWSDGSSVEGHWIQGRMHGKFKRSLLKYCREGGDTWQEMYVTVECWEMGYRIYTTATD